MGMILRIASSRIVGQGDIVGRSGYFSLNLSANSVMRGRLDARRTLKSLVADLRVSKEIFKSDSNKIQTGPCFLRFLYFIFYLVLRTERIGADLEDDEREDLLFTDFELPDFTDERDVVVPREERTELFTSFSVAF